MVRCGGLFGTLWFSKSFCEALIVLKEVHCYVISKQNTVVLIRIVGIPKGYEAQIRLISEPAEHTIYSDVLCVHRKNDESGAGVMLLQIGSCDFV